MAAIALLLRSRRTMRSITKESPANLYDETYNTLSVITLQATRVLLIVCSLNYIMYIIFFCLGDRFTRIFFLKNCNKMIPC